MRVKVRDATAAKQLAPRACSAKIDEVISQRPIGAFTLQDRKLNSREEAGRRSNEGAHGGPDQRDQAATQQVAGIRLFVPVVRRPCPGRGSRRAGPSSRERCRGTAGVMTLGR